MRRGLERRARRAYALKDYKRTRQLLDELLREVGENPHTLHMLARCSEYLAENEAARAYAARALAVEPEHFGALQVMTQVHYKLDELEEARRYARAAIAHLPDAPVLPPVLRPIVRLLGRGVAESGRFVEDEAWVLWARRHLLEEGDS